MNRKLLLFTTALVGASLFGYGRRAYGACTAVDSAVTCTGSATDNTSTQTITVNNAVVTANPGFGVNAAAGNAITVTGDGALRFIDNNAVNSVGITANGAGGQGIYFKSTGNAGGVAGSVTIETNQVITGNDDGINVRNMGAGNTDITVNGDVNATNDDGIDVFGVTSSGGVSLATGANSTITAGDRGISIQGRGLGEVNVNIGGDINAVGRGLYALTEMTSGAMRITTEESSDITSTGSDGMFLLGFGDASDITINGDITAEAGDGLRSINAFSDTRMVIGESSTITANNFGIKAYNISGGVLDVTINGDINSVNNNAVQVRNQNSSEDIIVTTGESSLINSGDKGIFVVNSAATQTMITVNGDIVSVDHGVYSHQNMLVHYSLLSSDVTIVTGENSLITSTGGRGVSSLNEGNGFSDVTVNGDITSVAEGVYIKNGTEATNVTLTVGSDSVINTTGAYKGIFVRNNGSGTTSVTISGDVTAESDNAVDIRQPNSASNVTMAINNGATVRSNGSTAIVTDAGKVLDLSIDNGNVIGTGGTAVDFGDGDDTLDLSGTVHFTGDIEAGDGTDTLNIGTATLDMAYGSSFLNFENVNITGKMTVPADSSVEIQSATPVNITDGVVIGVTDAATFGKLSGSNGFAFSNGAGITIDAASIGLVPSGTTLSNVLSGGPITGLTSGLLSDNAPAYKFTSVVNGDSVDIFVERLLSGPGVGNSSLIRVLETASLTSSNASLLSVVNTLAGYSNDAQMEAAVRTLLPDSNGVGFRVVESISEKNFDVVQKRLREVNRSEVSGISTGSAAKLRSTWGSLFGKDVAQGYRNGESGYDATMSGIVVGADFAVRDNTIVGLSFSYAKSSAESRSGYSESDADVNNLTVYLSHYFDNPFYINMMAAGGVSRINSERKLFDNTYALGDYNGRQFASEAMVGYMMKAAEWDVSPFVSAAYQYIAHDSYREQGSSLPLNVGEMNSRLIESEVGVKIARAFTYNDVKYAPQVSVGWQHNLVSNDIVSNVSLAAVPGNSFSTTVDSSGANRFNFGTGLEVEANDNTTFSLNYNLEAKKEFRAQSVLLNAKLNF